MVRIDKTKKEAKLTFLSMGLHDPLPHDESAHVLLRGEVFWHLVVERTEEQSISIITIINFQDYEKKAKMFATSLYERVCRK